MLATTHIILGIAVLLIVLGFFALLKQKTYIDATTNQPTEFELPLVGKLKTNFPALIFVVLGFGIVLRVFGSVEKSDPGKEEWLITGSFQADSAPVRWDDGLLSPFPSDIKAEIGDRGTFKITALLPKGSTFEDAVEYFDFSHPSWGSVQFYPKDEYALFTRHDPASRIREATTRARILKPLTPTPF